MIRLLSLHKNNDDKRKLISKDEWSEILAIPTNRPHKMGQADFAIIIAENYAKMWEELIEPDIHHDTIVGIICSVSVSNPFKFFALTNASTVVVSKDAENPGTTSEGRWPKFRSASRLHHLKHRHCIRAC